MKCDEFLARHSEFVDGRMLLPDVASCREHLKSCPTCARYHGVVERGRGLVRELPCVEPSSAFYMGLRHRLAQAKPAGRGPSAPVDSRTGPGALVALSIAAVVSLIAWSPLLRPQVLTVELPAMVARAPASPTVWRVRARQFSPPTRGTGVDWWPAPARASWGAAGIFPAFGGLPGATLTNGFLDSPWPTTGGTGLPRLRTSSLE